MSGAVDNQLERVESSGFFEHIEICGSCRDEFELEKLTKAYLRRRITLVDVPDDVEKAILKEITSMDVSTVEEVHSNRYAVNNLLQPLLAVGIVLVVAVVLFLTNMSNVIMPSSPTSKNNANGGSSQVSLSLVESNFQNVLNGQFRPQITSFTSGDVAKFVAQNAGYIMQLPAVPAAQWIGGSVSSVDGQKTFQIVYKMGETYIYIYGFSKQLLDLKKVTLPADCLNTLQQQKKFWTMDAYGDVQVVWGHGDHICIMTSNLGKSDLAGYLKTSNESPTQ